MPSLMETIPAENRMMLLRGPLDESPLGFFLTNERGGLEYVSREAARIIGFESSEEAREYSLHDIEPAIDCGLVEGFSDVLKGHNFQKTEHICTNRQGHFAVLNIFCSPYHDTDDRITGMFGIIQDVTESYHEKTRLEEAHYVLSIISQISAALSSKAELDEVLRMILIGVTAYQGLGFNRAFLFLADEEQNCLEGKMAIGPGSPEEAHEVWSRLAGKHKTLLELLNDYRTNEKAINNNISSLIADWRIPLDKPSIFKRALDNAEGLKISSAEDLKPESIEILNRLNTDKLAMAPIISKGRKLGLIAADNKITGRDITDSTVALLQTLANTSAVAIERSQLYDNILERADELEKINRRLEESQEQIVRAEKMSVIGELTSSIAHELRNPLMVIGGFANMMLSTGDGGENAEYLNIILSETQRAESVLHQVLDFSRASRTRSRAIEFNPLVVKAYNNFLSRLKFKQKKPKLSLSGNDIKVWGNPDQLQHVLYQFIRLTVEDMTEECNIQISTGLNGNMVRLTIGFEGDDEARRKVVKTLSQIFGSSTGTQKLSMLVAGETIRYHGGNYGVEGSAENLPRLYLELPQIKGGYDG